MPCLIDMSGANIVSVRSVRIDSVSTLLLRDKTFYNASISADVFLTKPGPTDNTPILVEFIVIEVRKRGVLNMQLERSALVNHGSTRLWSSWMRCDVTNYGTLEMTSQYGIVGSVYNAGTFRASGLSGAPGYRLAFGIAQEPGAEFICGDGRMCAVDRISTENGAITNSLSSLTVTIEVWLNFYNNKADIRPLRLNNKGPHQFSFTLH